MEVRTPSVAIVLAIVMDSSAQWLGPRAELASQGFLPAIRNQITFLRDGGTGSDNQSEAVVFENHGVVIAGLGMNDLAEI
jgi:hypothetical protein